MNEIQNKSAIKNQQSAIRGIDWDDVKRRLARSQEALVAVEQLSAEQARTLMDERARMLARVPDRTPDTSEVLEVMTFHLGDERLAIETRFVREVFRPSDMSPLPNGPAFLAGITNLRGEVLAIMDLRRFFGITSDRPPTQAPILVLGKQRVEFGVVADAIDEVQMLRIDEVLDPPGSMAGVSREYLTGVTEDALLVLDGAALMSDEHMYIDEKE